MKSIENEAKSTIVRKINISRSVPNNEHEVNIIMHYNRINSMH